VERQIQAVQVPLPRGQGAPAVYCAWCSVRCVLDDLAALGAEGEASRRGLSFEEWDQRLRDQLPAALQSVGEFDLTSPAAQRVLEEQGAERVRVPAGFRVAECVLRRVVPEEEYERELQDLAAARLAVERVRNDERIADATEQARAEQALAAIENERLRSLLTVEEQARPASERLKVYDELLSAPGRGPWLTRRTFWIGVAALGAAVVLAPLLVRMLLPTGPAFPLALYWHGFGQRLQGGTWTEFHVEDGTTMFDGDQFRLHFVPTADCHAYILCFNAEGSVTQLFPNPAIQRGNSCRAGQEVQVPDGVNWFTLNDSTGTETLWLVGSHEPLPALDEKLVLIARGEGGTGTVEAIRAEIERIENQNQPGEDGEVRTPGGLLVRGVEIQPDRRVSHATLKSGRQVEGAMHFASGKATVVHRIQFAHRHPRERP
jgi:hypothetical protein